MYHRFAKSLKPSNRTVAAMASNPAGLGDISLEWFDFYGRMRSERPQTSPQIQSDPEGGIPSGSLEVLGGRWSKDARW
jgi:hypothetical protein